MQDDRVQLASALFLLMSERLWSALSETYILLATIQVGNELPWNTHFQQTEEFLSKQEENRTMLRVDVLLWGMHDKNDSIAAQKCRAGSCEIPEDKNEP